MYQIDEGIKQHFSEWWARKNEKPLIKLLSAKKEFDRSRLIDVEAMIDSDEDRHFNPDVNVAVNRNFREQFHFLADSFSYIDINLGPGSLACYLKCEPVFARDTVWYREADGELEDLFDISYEKSTKWWNLHLAKIRRALEISDGMPVAIPDLIENIDILAAMRGPQTFCFDLYDSPDAVKTLVGKIDDLYFRYYDPIYDMVKLEDDSSVYTAFSIWGKGRTAKIQCDFAALISPEQFDEFVLPSLEKQCARLDNVLFHLDGKEAIRHVDSLMTLERLNAINWTPGDGQPDAGDEKWFPLYDKVIGAGKGLWLGIGQGTPDRWIACAKKILKRYGPRGIYFLFGIPSEEDGYRILRELNY